MIERDNEIDSVPVVSLEKLSDSVDVGVSLSVTSYVAE